MSDETIDGADRPSPPTRAVRIGEWTFEPDAAALVGPDGTARKLADRAARTLALLSRRRGEVVGGAAILQEVWGGRQVSANSVAVVIADLRRALGDDARAPRHILTVAKRGYRLALEPAPIGEPVQAPAPRRRPVALALGAAVILAGLLGAAAVELSAPAKPIVRVEETHNDTGAATDAPLARSLNALVVDRLARTKTIAVARGGDAADGGPERGVELSSRLIVWNGEPTLSMVATDRRSNQVIWTDMVEGDPNHIAAPTLVAVDRLAARVAHGD